MMPTRPRAYGLFDLRQEGRARLVFSEEDLLRALTLAAQKETPLNVLLGSDIILTKTITIPSSIPAFTMNGGGKFRFLVSGAFFYLFDCNASPTVFEDVFVELLSGASVEMAFVARAAASPTILRNVSVDASAGTLVDVFAVQGASQSSKIIVDTASFLGIQNLFRQESVAYTHCRMQDITVTGVGSSTVTFGRGSTAPTFKYSAFERISGPLVIDIGTGSDKCVFSMFRTTSGSSSITTNNSSITGHAFINMDGYSAVTLNGLDVLVGDPPASFAGIATRSFSVALNSASPTLTPGNKSFIRVTHGASASGSVTIAAGVDGQQLTLYFASVAGTAVYTDGSGNLQLAGDFTPTVNDTLSLIYDTTSSRWVETSRSVN